MEHILSSDKLSWWAAVASEDKCEPIEISVSADVTETFEHEHDCCCLAADASTQLEKEFPDKSFWRGKMCFGANHDIPELLRWRTSRCWQDPSLSITSATQQTESLFTRRKYLNHNNWKWCDVRLRILRLCKSSFPWAMEHFLARSVKYLLLEFIVKQISHHSSGWRFAPLCCSPPASSGR